MVENPDCRSEELVLNPALPLNSCGTLGRLIKPFCASVSLYYFINLMKQRKGLIKMKLLGQCLEQKSPTISKLAISKL